MKISASRKQLFISTQITLLLMIKACGTVPPANEDRGTSHLDETVTVEMRREKYGTIIGIDLGTTYSCVGVFKNGKVEILSNSASSRTTPSTLSWDKEHDLRYIGEDAINRQVFDPINTIYDVKRIIGRDYNDSALQRDIINWPFHVVNRNNKPHISFSTGGKGAKEYSPELISAMVLERLKETAENYLGRNISYAVITVPAYFNDAQRQATKDAGEIAGLNVVRILNEPTAAAIAYGIQNKHTRRNILVFDLGGGTFDVSVLQIEKSDFKVLAVNGDTHLGGADFDQRLIDFLLKGFEAEKVKFNIRKNHRAMQRLRIEVEKAKRTLSSEIIATINIEEFFEGVDFHDRITREKFEQLNMDYFKAAIAIVKKVIIDAKLAASDMDEIVLVGGSTRIPKLKSMLLSEFPGVPVNRDIDPDEAVAYGATYLAAAIGGEISTTNLRFTDVNPLSLGISLIGDIFKVVIPRNTFIPVTESVTDFTTTYDNQKNVLFSVYEGERLIASENHFLGKFVLENIQIAMKGEPRFKVTMELDLNGILHVSATDMQTASTKSITIRDDDKRLSPEDVKRSLEEAKKYADRDNNIKKLINDINKYGLELENVKMLLRRKLVHCKHLTAEELALQNLAEKSSDWLLKVDQLDQLSIKKLKKNKENFDRMLHPLFDQLRDKHCLPSCGEIKATYGSELVDTKKKLNDINSNCGKLTFLEREILKVIEWSSDWLLGLKHDDAQCVEKIQENKTNLDKVLQPISDRLLNSDSCSRSKSLQYQALSAEIMRRMAKAFGRHGLSIALLGEVIDIVALLTNELSTWELGVVAMVVGAAAYAVYSLQLKYRHRRRRRAYERNSRIRQPTPVEDTDAMSDGTEDENATLEMRSEYERFRPEEQQTAERRRHREES